MQSKLKQMDDVIRGVVDLLDDDTLLILLGDHGMDKKGDHGGDGELETSSGLWFYSKSRPLVDLKVEIPTPLLINRTFPEAEVAHRFVQQIDLVPTLSLLLGLPIPFNNLGTVIPELFWGEALLEQALQINGAQIKRYLDTYRSSPAGGELDTEWDRVESSWAAAISGNMTSSSMSMFTRYALDVCRMMWAQFNVSLMTLGLTILLSGTVATFAVYDSLGRIVQWEPWLDSVQRLALRWSLIGGASGLVIAFPARVFVKDINIVDYVLFSTALASSVQVIRNSLPLHHIKNIDYSSLPLPLILHVLLFTSSPYTSWEDHIIPYLMLTSLIPLVLAGFSAPTQYLRKRILLFSLLFAICVRLIATSTVCREEQEPYCQVTFFSGPTITTPPDVILCIVVPISTTLPWIIRQYLKISRSDKGLATVLLSTAFRGAFISSSFVWILEWIETSELFGASWSDSLRTTRIILAWLCVVFMPIIVLLLWWISTRAETNKFRVPQKDELSIIGYANTLHSSYLIFWLITFSLVFATSQLSAQVVLSLTAIALLSFLEVIDSVRAVRALNLAFVSTKPSSVLAQIQGTQRTRPSINLRFSEITPIALLGLQAFYGTGHQPVISTIQWKSAFLLTSTLTYPFSPILVIINTFGPVFVFALAAPLIAFWNAPPLSYHSSNIQNATLRAGLGISLYYMTLLLGSATSSAFLRRHLMVWPVFAPRFMLAAASLITVDFAVVIGFGIGYGRIKKSFGRALGTLPAANGGDAEQE
ncbi:hypothetical protein QCA50_002576 [Cerrena zonata]|uniref:Sulfatase N-terminal domain-containing protein n=1 Tax=Cerrena zonata TaxID=2478898 RepID=A0AAW0GK42_9APHY